MLQITEEDATEGRLWSLMMETFWIGALAGLMASVRLRLPFAIALVLLDGAGGHDRKKIALPKIIRSRRKKPFSMSARIELRRTNIESRKPCMRGELIRHRLD